MKNRIFAIATIIGLGLSARADGTNTTSSLATERDRVSYAIGLQMGHSLKQVASEIDSETLFRAIKDVLSGAPESMSKEEVMTTLKGFQEQMRAKLMQQQQSDSLKNKAAGEAFLATNKSQPGVQVKEVDLNDGSKHQLQYIVITNGSGALPQPNDTVKVNYRGTLLDGTEFDSSYKHGQPATFKVNQVIPGWTQALEMMPVGSKWKLFIPADLAYGDHGVGSIPAGSLLVFEVELLDVAPAPVVTAPANPSATPLTSDIIKVPSADDMKKGAKIEVIKSQDAPAAAGK